ncbi:hypothetical protein HPB47_007422 [Ixodes persulcatus]|uniref:Uncharacterized protein n=1 Tax=Ixodes persulcatus TaxID=34615 RepID=A0AC60P7L7_IXOPE|nr:hypothetical protein HPB47_007422 [Ixodes persulcatus]
MSTSQPNFRSLITLAEVATRGLTSDPLVPIGDPAASYASRVLSPSQPGAPLIGGRASADGPTRASPFRDGSLLRPEPYAAPIRASVVGSFDATPLGGGADHRHLGVATDQANALPGSHMTTSPVRDGYQVRRPPGHFPMGGNPAAGPSAPLFCGGARSSAQFGASPIRDGALPDGHEAVPLPRDSIPPWPAQSTTPIGVNAAGDLIELPADNVHPPAPCDPAPFRAGASPVSGLEASLFGDGPRAPPVSSAAPLGAGAGSSHDVLLQEAARVIESLTGAMHRNNRGHAGDAVSRKPVVDPAVARPPLLGASAAAASRVATHPLIAGSCGLGRRDKARLASLLYSYDSMFTDRPGCADSVRHRIDTGEAPAWKCHPRPVLDLF